MGPAPRDVETFAEVIAALDSVTNEQSAYQIAVDAFVRASGVTYGAAWLPEENGELRLIHETGTIAGQMAAAFPSRRNTVDHSLVGKAYRTGQPIFVEDLTGATESVRAQTARGFGMVAGLFYPVTHERRRPRAPGEDSGHRQARRHGRVPGHRPGPAPGGRGRPTRGHRRRQHDDAVRQRGQL
jgi:hypothetical protein